MPTVGILFLALAALAAIETWKHGPACVEGRGIGVTGVSASWEGSS